MEDLETAARDRRSHGIWPWLLVVLAVAGAAWIRSGLLDVPLERDEGEFAYMGQLMLRGVPPYEAAYNMKFPGTYAAYAGSLALFGESVRGVRLGHLLVNGATIVLLFLLGRRLLDSLAGGVAALVFAATSLSRSVLGVFAHATHFLSLFAVAGLLPLVGPAPPSALACAASGALLGLAVLMKQHGLLLAAFAAAYLPWTLRRDHGLSWREVASRARAFAVGLATPLAITGLVLWRAGVFERFWFWTIRYAATYASHGTAAEGWDALRQRIPDLLSSFPAVWVLALAGGVACATDSRLRRARPLLAGLFLAALATALPGFYLRRHYFVPLLPALGLLAGAAASSLCARSGGRRGAALLAAALGVAASLDVVARERQMLFRLGPSEVSRLHYATNPFPESLEVAEYLRAHTAPADRIAVLGSEPQIYFYADRRSATGYIYMYPLMENQPHAEAMQRELITQVEQSRPAYVVFVGVAWSWLPQPGAPQLVFEWAGRYLAGEYERVGLVNIRPGGSQACWGADLPRCEPVASDHLVVLRRR